jgi:hypothetical protein
MSALTRGRFARPSNQRTGSVSSNANRLKRRWLRFRLLRMILISAAVINLARSSSAMWRCRSSVCRKDYVVPTTVGSQYMGQHNKVECMLARCGCWAVRRTCSSPGYRISTARWPENLRIQPLGSSSLIVARKVASFAFVVPDSMHVGWSELNSAP